MKGTAPWSELFLFFEVFFYQALSQMLEAVVFGDLLLFLCSGRFLS
jgi:hypothetical protein